MDCACTMSVLAARPALAALRLRGIDPERALAAAHVSAEALASSENRLPHAGVRDLWECAAEIAGDPSFGLHAAQAQPAGIFELFDYLFSLSEKCGDALRLLGHYIRLLHDHSHFEIIVEPQQARIVRRAPDAAPQWDEFSLALLFLRSRESSGVAWPPEQVAFQHQRAVDDGEPRRLFGCEVAFGTPHDELRVAPWVLDLPHVHRDSRLMEVLGRYAESLLAALPADGPLLTRVSVSIAQRMAHSVPSLVETAQAMRIPPRTLQRRLAAEGTSHSALVDEVRRSLALKYIGDAGMGVAEIAWLLHFTDATALHRAFRRWTGESPSQYRTRLYGRPQPA